MLRNQYSYAIKISLIFFSSIIGLSIVIYAQYFRYSEEATYLDSQGNTAIILKDNLISSSLKYSTCYCFDKAYFVVKLNNDVVYSFFRDFQEFPDFFDIIKIDSNNIVIESHKCFVFKIPYKLENITRSDLEFVNKDCSKSDFQYYQSAEFIKDYELKYFFFPVVK